MCTITLYLMLICDEDDVHYNFITLCLMLICDEDDVHYTFIFDVDL